MVNDEEILPSFWSGSYFSLAPGESTTVTVSCPNKFIKDKTTLIRISGWNVKEITLASVR
jgi:hypothetical protein